MKKIIHHNLRSIFLASWLVLANLVYFSHSPIGWVVTLGCFFFVPGLLLLVTLQLPASFKPYRTMFAIGLSILLVMLAGLVINELSLFGIQRPLSTLNIFIGLDILVVGLLGLTYRQLQSEAESFSFHIPQFSLESLLVLAVSALLPVLAIFGAIRLNNGASDILTLILFGSIPCLFIWLVFRPGLEKIHTFTLFATALSLLFSISMRGWHITGHDIQIEYYVFQLTLQHQHWDISAYKSAYNACMSITLLPTIVAKLTQISPPYVYKVVFQVLFATALIPIYWFIRLTCNQKIALIGSLIFVSFPVFLNDMSMLNRQEIAFMFFALLLLVTSIPNLTVKQKNVLSLFMFSGLILAHYSSTYVALALLIGARLVYALVVKINKSDWGSVKPVFIIDWRLLLIALLATFLWNIQVTNTGSGLTHTIATTLESTINHTGSQSADVGASLFSTSSSPDYITLLNNYASSSGTNQSSVQYVGSPTLPLTNLGAFLQQHGINILSLNQISKEFSSAVLQLFILLGVAIMGLRIWQKRSLNMVYVFCLSVSAVALLALQTVLPQLSVEYGTLRLLQQLLLILVIPIMIAAMALVPLAIRTKIRVMGVFFAILSLLITSFVGQILGAYLPVLALNNSGDYYEEYYVHGGELDAANWLLANRNPSVRVDMDRYAELRFTDAIESGQLEPRPLAGFNKNDYVYEDYANITTNSYQGYLNATHFRYMLTINLQSQKDTLYDNGESKILK